MSEQDKDFWYEIAGGILFMVLGTLAIFLMSAPV